MFLQRLVFYTLLLFSSAVLADVCVGPPTATSPVDYAMCEESGLSLDKTPSFKHIESLAQRFKYYLRLDSFSPGTAASNLRILSKPGGHML